MSFHDELINVRDFDFDAFWPTVTTDRIQAAIRKDRCSPRDFLTLLSPVAVPFLEEMAQKAREITIRQFGRTMTLFTPMYLSNYCGNQCVYCGFNCTNTINRKKLTLAEVETEARAIAATGLKHILILTGEAPGIAGVDYVKDCCQILKQWFSSISIEIFVLETDDYKRLIDVGVDGLIIYQETYNEALYKTLHLKGPKKDFRFRLDGPERGCLAGMRSVGIGALLGLDDWRRDIFFTALHADYLLTAYPEVEISISLPRMRPHVGSYEPACIVNDVQMVQIMTALRLFLPRCGISISTRESEIFRNNIMGLGVTKMSAGSSTAVGGHTQEDDSVGQFDISDERNVEEMCLALQNRGFQPVFKDWEPIDGINC
jgi:2-iminoacetate synthase